MAFNLDQTLQTLRGGFQGTNIAEVRRKQAEEREAKDKKEQLFAVEMEKRQQEVSKGREDQQLMDFRKDWAAMEPLLESYKRTGNVDMLANAQSYWSEREKKLEEEGRDSSYSQMVGKALGAAQMSPDPTEAVDLALQAGDQVTEALYESGAWTRPPVTDVQKINSKLRSLGYSNGEILRGPGADPERVKEADQARRELYNMDGGTKGASVKPGDYTWGVDGKGMISQFVKGDDKMVAPANAKMQSIHAQRPELSVNDPEFLELYRTQRSEQGIQDQVNYHRNNIKKADGNLNLVREGFGRVKAIGMNATPASDLALVFNYMKMLDPNSVVRESEFRTAAQAKEWLVKSEEVDPETGEAAFRVPAPIADWIRRADEGTLLAPHQRADFLDQTDSLMHAAVATNDKAVEDLMQWVDADDLDRARVLGKKRTDAMAKRSTWPQVGEIIDGMQYIGGDPAGEVAWKTPSAAALATAKKRPGG